MIRIRRYRVFLALAGLFIFLIYRTSVNSAVDDEDNSFLYRSNGPADVLVNTARKGVVQADVDQKPILHNVPSDADGLDKQDKVKIPELKPTPDFKDNLALPTPTLALPDNAPPLEQQVVAVPVTPPLPTDPPVVEIPDRRPGEVGDVYVNKDDKPSAPLHIQKPPGRVEPDITFTPPIHWTKLPEHFPIDEASLISLPTGKPIPIPTIQHASWTEGTESKEKREGRMLQIKTEMKRAWDAYKTYAFGHDEYAPFNNGFRDPFCGWAATLVDAMDTLWIMGLKKEFDEAYDGLSSIDFTTSTRNEIPVFETTIRYLGGLIAAYDVTGGHQGDYPLLLKKAVELAEVLMGVFDTPNRMPLLYYNWKPAYVSQPKRANVRAGIAEFGTLSMEFTRLAQLTGKDKYYDAIARITNALDEWQNREDDTASLIPGIFPENIDASGCNKSAPQPDSINSVSSGAQQQIKAGLGSPQTKPQGYVPKGGPDPRDTLPRDVTGAAMRARKRENAALQSSGAGPNNHGPNDHWSTPYKANTDSPPLAANGIPEGWDCVAQNLTASPGGTQQYSMGGSQDSAYEYFPKQYLLLGGLEAKYRSMHEKTVAAVKKHLLFRPMVKDNADILFSAKAKVSTNVNVSPSDRIQLEYEVTHLTCFLGGMFAMGGKIFGSEEDLNVGRRLTDGCVWAYSSMPAGIMAEYAQVSPCIDMDSCQWNETAWYLNIDPTPEFRDQQMRTYEKNLAKWEQDRRIILREEAERLQAEQELGERFERIDKTKPKPEAGRKPANLGRPSVSSALPRELSSGSVTSRRDDDVQYDKRDFGDEEASPRLYDPSKLDQDAIEMRVKKLEMEIDALGSSVSQLPPPPGSFGGTAGQIPIDYDYEKTRDLALALKLPSRPNKPSTHREYVTRRIESEHLPPGYTAVGSSVYTLR